MTPTLSTKTVRKVTAEEIATYRDVVRSGLSQSDGNASPLHAFVLASPVIDESVGLIGAATADGSPLGRVHLSQEIHVQRAIRADEPVTVALDVVGTRKSLKGVQVAMKVALLGEDGSQFAELITGAMLVGAVTPDTFGQLPPHPGKGSTAEPTIVAQSIARDTVTKYAHASGDLNPIHLDDNAARDAGFGNGVIAHGMSVLAVVTEEVIDRYAGGDASRIKSVGARFSSAVLPDTPLEIVLQEDTEDLLAESSIGTAFVRFSCKTQTGPALKSGWVELGE
ncbi:MaoC family dehydratase N-terminal domain-containing protein [Kibdelosporangium philippinense]|uniref:MaoC family dehydratase N-terminal domain-containing protein n=1 Tax=Kibdelosporangium philippinense TaxID=211113 RepID=A0ABS8Z3H6_9PSEU|nr:MaoC/PaaZ C-terminal domain-containing protein [Kibdelosporangium philippinense]MCE7001479.1 MaoC family dehydratase N-terminal domain-containing protein [Kibdelosporangium philippinense]